LTLILVANSPAPGSKVRRHDLTVGKQGRRRRGGEKEGEAAKYYIPRGGGKELNPFVWAKRFNTGEYR